MRKKTDMNNDSTWIGITLSIVVFLVAVFLAGMNTGRRVTIDSLLEEGCRVTINMRKHVGEGRYLVKVLESDAVWVVVK